MSEDLLHDLGSEGERARVAIGEGAVKSEGWSMVDSALLGRRRGRDGHRMAGLGNVLPGEVMDWMDEVTLLTLLTLLTEGTEGTEGAEGAEGVACAVKTSLLGRGRCGRVWVLCWRI